MKRIARLASGSLLGTALVLALSAFDAAPAAAVQSQSFCDETENFICCCSVNSVGSIIECACQSKPPAGGGDNTPIPST